MSGAKLVQIPVGDGTPALRTPFEQSWILVLSNLMMLLHTDPAQRTVSSGLQAFARETLFSRLPEKSKGNDLSAALCLQLTDLLRSLFNNQEIEIRASGYSSDLSGNWASVVLSARDIPQSLGILFTSSQPHAQLFDPRLSSGEPSKAVLLRNYDWQQQQQQQQPSAPQPLPFNNLKDTLAQFQNNYQTNAKRPHLDGPSAAPPPRPYSPDSMRVDRGAPPWNGNAPLSGGSNSGGYTIDAFKNSKFGNRY